MSREGDREPAVGVVLSEEDFGYGRTSLFPREPCLNDRRDILCCPSDRKSPSVNQYQYRGGAGPAYCLQKVFLESHQIQAGHVFPFPAQAPGFPEHHNGDILLALIALLKKDNRTANQLWLTGIAYDMVNEQKARKGL